ALKSLVCGDSTSFSDRLLEAIVSGGRMSDRLTRRSRAPRGEGDHGNPEVNDSYLFRLGSHRGWGWAARRKPAHREGRPGNEPGPSRLGPGRDTSAAGVVFHGRGSGRLSAFPQDARDPDPEPARAQCRLTGSQDLSNAIAEGQAGCG